MDNLIPGNVNFIVLFIVVSMAFTGCTTMYIPTMQNAPMLEERGDLQATVTNKNFQVTYAPTDNVGAFVNFKRKSKRIIPISNDKSGNWNGSNYAFEMAVGTFKSNERDFFIGYGNGYSSISFSGGGGSAHFRKLFLQTDLYSGKVDAKTQIGFGLRASILDFYDFVDKSGGQINTHPFFLEPSFMLKENLKVVAWKFQMQYLTDADLGDSFYTYSYYKPYKRLLLFFVSIEIYLDEIFPGLKPWKNKGE